MIKSEIRERNFFLFCDSTAALESDWVKKERAEVERARRRRPIRTGSISVEGGRIDLGELDAFLANTRAYLSFSRNDRVHVPKFVEALRAAGYAVWFDDEFIVGPIEKIEMEINSAVKEGWLIFFASKFSLHKGSPTSSILMRGAWARRWLP